MKGDKPKKLPKRFSFGLYKATMVTESPEGAEWRIVHALTQHVGTMFDGGAYGWGMPRCSLRPLVWSGPIPDDCTSPRSPHYGIHFDTGPAEETHQAALERFAKAADRLMAWRRKSTQSVSQEERR